MRIWREISQAEGCRISVLLLKLKENKVTFLICQYESIELVSRKRNGDILILENSNPGKYGESEWRILKISKSGHNEFSYAGETQMNSERRKELNDILEDYLTHKTNTDDPVLCLYLPQRVFSECVRRLKSLTSLQ